MPLFHLSGFFFFPDFIPCNWNALSALLVLFTVFVYVYLFSSSFPLQCTLLLPTWYRGTQGSSPWLCLLTPSTRGERYCAISQLASVMAQISIRWIGEQQDEWKTGYISKNVFCIFSYWLHIDRWKEQNIKNRKIFQNDGFLMTSLRNKKQQACCLKQYWLWIVTLPWEVLTAVQPLLRGGQWVPLFSFSSPPPFFVCLFSLKNSVGHPHLSQTFLSSLLKPAFSFWWFVVLQVG